MDIQMLEMDLLRLLALSESMKGLRIGRTPLAALTANVMKEDIDAFLPGPGQVGLTPEETGKILVQPNELFRLFYAVDLLA